MAEVTATNLKTYYIGNQKMVTGRVAGLTSSGGHVAARSLGLFKITNVVGVAGSHATPSAKNAVRNSQNGTADTATRDGDLWVDAGTTQTVFFTVIGR